LLDRHPTVRIVLQALLRAFSTIARKVLPGSAWLCLPLITLTAPAIHYRLVGCYLNWAGRCREVTRLTQDRSKNCCLTKCSSDQRRLNWSSRRIAVTTKLFAPSFPTQHFPHILGSSGMKKNTQVGLSPSAVMTRTEIRFNSRLVCVFGGELSDS
jgi:hypothetical protein